MALSNITGCASGSYYETTNEHLMDCVLEHYGSVTAKDETSILKQMDVYNLEGSNEYLLVQFDDDNVAIYSKEGCEIVKTYSEFNFTQLENKFVVYSDSELGFDFAYYVENSDSFEALIGQNFDEQVVATFYDTMEKKAGEYYRDIDITSDAHVIDNSFYFEKLHYRHAWNYNGTCTIVASEILFGYYDTFQNDNLVDESYDIISRQAIYKTDFNVEDFNVSPGADDYSTDTSDFHDYLCEIARDEIHDDPEIDGMSTVNQIKLIKNYLSKRNIQYTLSTSEGNWGDFITSRAETLIKNAINNNRPIISNGKYHSTVAFAYDDDYVWVHTGWGYVAATPWSTYRSNLFTNYTSGCIDIVSLGDEHVHSDNYYAYNKNQYICPCGEKFTSSLITPEDYGFEPQYYFYSKSKSFVADSISINTNRLRCGYIEEEYINLSPKRSGAGTAYLEYYFDKAVRKFDMNLSYWQSLDRLSKLNSSADFYVLKHHVDESSDYYYWEHSLDLIDANLTTDRYNQDSFSFNYVGNEVFGFKFYLTSPATGDRNLGRISIGNITLVHSL